MNDNLDCRTCNGKCNKKGYPSVSKNSLYCQEQRNVIAYERINVFHNIKTKLDKLFKQFLQKGRMK